MSPRNSRLLNRYKAKSSIEGSNPLSLPYITSKIPLNPTKLRFALYQCGFLRFSSFAPVACSHLGCSVGCFFLTVGVASDSDV
jgi:hypothetical protein